MKPTLLSLVLFAVTAAGANPQAPAGAADEQLLTVIKELQAQQATLAENQAKIDERLAAVIEGVRVARIYSSRSGH
ncbi:MAG: hypothetical protein ACR2NX_09800 [Chthoniobacterales bacterium]